MDLGGKMRQITMVSKIYRIVWRYYYVAQQLLKPKNFDYFTIKFRTMNKLKLLAALCFTTLLFTNCDKTDEAPPTNTDHITTGSWKFSSAKASGIDVTAQVPACFKDNTMTFAINGTGTISEGANVCAPPAPATFTWTFQNNGSEINLSVPIVSGGSTVFTIVTLNAATLVVSQTMTIAPTPPTNVELTFIH